MPELDLKVGTKEQFFLPVLQALPWHVCLSTDQRASQDGQALNAFFHPPLINIFNKNGRFTFGLLPAWGIFGQPS